MWKLRHVFKSRSAKASPSTRSQSGTRNASPSLTIEDRYYFHATTVFGLRIETGSERPVIVGYSIQCKNGHILDVPAHQLNASGLVLWHIEAPQACQNGEGTPYDGWSGRIVFALWE